jgi:hypothetical protein
MDTRKASKPKRRNTMNTRQTRVSRIGSLAIALALLAGLAPAVGAEERPGGRDCSVASLHGSYGFYRTGKGTFGGPLAAQGIAFFDGEGDFHTTANVSRDGEIFLDEEIFGTYEIAPDCTGKFLDNDSEFERFVVIDDGKGWYSLFVFGGTVYSVGTRIHNGRGDRVDR